MQHALKFRVALAMLVFGDGGDDVGLGVEIAIERAGADLRFGADFLHRRLVEAAAAETQISRVHDLLAAALRQMGIGEAGHAL